MPLFFPFDAFIWCSQTHKEQTYLTTDLWLAEKHFWARIDLSGKSPSQWVHLGAPSYQHGFDAKRQAIASAKRLQTGQADDTRNRTSWDQQVVIWAFTGGSAAIRGDRGRSTTTYTLYEPNAGFSMVAGAFARYTIAITGGGSEKNFQSFKKSSLPFFKDFHHF